MARQTLAALLSFILAFGPAAAPALAQDASAPLPLPARIQAARETLKSHFSGATLARADYASLETEFKAAAENAEVKTAWDAFEPPAHKYNALRGGLLDLPNAQLSEQVLALSRELGLPAEGEDALLARYAQLKASLLENGIKCKDGKFYRADGRPFTESEFTALIAKRVPGRMSDEQRLAAAGDIKALAEVKDAIGKKDYSGAVDKLNRVLDGMGQNKELLQSGFGSLPMQTALSLIQKTREALPSQYRAQVDTKGLDSQLLAVANKKIEVPDAPSVEKAGAKQPEAPFRTGVQLSFYAALTGFPMLSHWAGKKLYEVTGDDALAKNPEVAAYRYSEADPNGQPKPGFSMTFKDGSKRYESRDGYSLVTSADGKRALEQDAKAGSVRMTEVGPDGKSVEIYAWKSDGKGGLAGHFRGTRFNATVGEHIQLTPDGSRLFITGKGPDGQPVSRWYDKSGAMGKILAGGLGELVLAKDEDGFVRKDIVLYPKVLAKAADGQLDLSPLKNDLPAGQLEKFGAFLNSLSQFGELFNQSLRGTGSSALSDAFIRDGKLYLKLGSREMIVDIMPDGVTRAFYQASHTTFLWKFDASGTKCEQFTPDAKAEVQENRLAFNLSRRYEKQGSTWVQTLNIPLKMEDAPSGWKMAGGAALDTLGTAGEIVFSPFQTAHHGIHAGLVSGMGHAAGVGNFADMDAIYTLRQATFNKWLGQGLETHDQVLEAYGQGLPSDPAKRKEVEGFVDTKVEEYRKQRWGEAYDLHKDEKITRDERAYAAARVFGLSNLAQNYFDAGKESYRNGSTAGAVGNYAVGAFAIGGQMYVQGFGFGAAAQGLKVMAVGARTGLTAEQVAAAAQRAALLERGAVGVAGLTKAETTAVGMLKTASRVETAMFVAPGGAQVGISGYQGIKSWRAGETSAALGHLDNFISGAASFLIPMGIGKGSQMTNDVVVKVTQMKGTETTTVRKGQDELVADKRKLDGDAADHAQRILLTDSMTELPNRSWMERNAEQLAAKLAKPTVAVMDMNNFGAVNDGLIGINGPSKGRALADTILSKAGFRLLRLAQAHDVQIARFGGEEFAVVGEQQAVLKFLDASKLEFQDGQVLRDVGYGPESKEMKAITAATAARNRAGQSIGDFTTGVASMKGRGFTDSWHAADLALKSAKETPGGRGNAFAERVGEDGKPAYELTTPALDASEIEAQNAAKAGRDAKVGTHTPRDIADDIHELKGKLTAEEYQKFKKVAFVDPLTQTREYDYVRAQAPEWAQKYAKGGEATLMSARGLKLINDALGHEAGDRYLTALGRELRNIVIDQRAGGNWLEEPARVASKDFLVVGQKAGPAARALDKAMRRVMASEEVLSKEQRAQVAELARSRGEDPNLTGTLRVVDSPFVHDAGGQADMFATMDHLIDLSDSAKQKEQPVPPAPPVVTSKH